MTNKLFVSDTLIKRIRFIEQFWNSKISKFFAPYLITTPFALINEILDKLPIDWKSPDLTFLDPCCGSGRFLLCVKYRLLEAGHSEKHILENMIHGCDIDPVNVKGTVAMLGGMEYNHNIKCENSLTEKWTMKFDVVCGNPPYQNEQASEGRKTATKPLWFTFTELAISLTKDGGLIAFVTPSSWVQSTSNIHRIITSKQVIYSKVYSKSPFGTGIGTTASFWVVRNIQNPSMSPLIINFDDVPIKVLPGTFLPSKATNITTRINILEKTLNRQGQKFDVRTTMQHHTLSHKDRLSDVRTGMFVYPIFHNNNSTLYSSLKDELHGLPKVLVAKKGSINKAIVNEDSSLSQDTIAFVTSTIEQAVVCLYVLKSKLYKFIQETVRTNSNIPSDVWRNLPAVDLTHKWTDEELYQHFNLTQEEIDLIESTIK